MKNSESQDQPLDQWAVDYGLEVVHALTDDELDPLLVSSLPVDWARENCLLPVRIRGNLCVLTCNPENIEQQEHLALLVGQSLRPLLASRTLILDGIERCYYSKNESPTDFIEDLQPDTNATEVRSGVDDLLQVAQNAPVTQLINLILLDAFKKRASDIHFEPLESSLRVRYRIDGFLYEQASPPRHMIESLVSRLKVMSHLDIAERRLPQDGMARVRVGEREFDIRVSVIPVAEGERVVLRLLDKKSALLPMSSLGMQEGCLAQFMDLVTEPHGLIVVSGPTGSGKTTTLYAALGSIDSSRRNILTIEDPIEYQLEHIGQIQVRSKIGLTFSAGLRSILRQDPDVILVGETRDAETASIGIRASLTGHLVFTTLHTNDAPGAIVRLLDMGIEPYLLASCLRGVLAQRLVRILCPACRRESQMSAADADRLGLVGSDRDMQTWEPVGCDHCIQGYRGRTGLFELLTVNPDVLDLIRSGTSTPEDIRHGVRGGLTRSLMEEGIERIKDGTTSVADLLTVASL